MVRPTSSSRFEEPTTSNNIIQQFNIQKWNNRNGSQRKFEREENERESDMAIERRYPDLNNGRNPPPEDDSNHERKSLNKQKGRVESLDCTEMRLLKSLQIISSFDHNEGVELEVSLRDYSADAESPNETSTNIKLDTLMEENVTNSATSKPNNYLLHVSPRFLTGLVVNRKKSNATSTPRKREVYLYVKTVGAIEHNSKSEGFSISLPISSLLQENKNKQQTTIAWHEPQNDQMEINGIYLKVRADLKNFQPVTFEVGAQCDNEMVKIGRFTLQLNDLNFETKQNAFKLEILLPKKRRGLFSGKTSYAFKIHDLSCKIQDSSFLHIMYNMQQKILIPSSPSLDKKKTIDDIRSNERDTYDAIREEKERSFSTEKISSGKRHNEVQTIVPDILEGRIDEGRPDEKSFSENDQIDVPRISACPTPVDCKSDLESTNDGVKSANDTDDSILSIANTYEDSKGDASTVSLTKVAEHHVPTLQELEQEANDDQSEPKGKSTATPRSSMTGANEEVSPILEELSNLEAEVNSTKSEEAKTSPQNVSTLMSNMSNRSIKSDKLLTNKMSNRSIKSNKLLTNKTPLTPQREFSSLTSHASHRSIQSDTLLTNKLSTIKNSETNHGEFSDGMALKLPPRMSVRSVPSVEMKGVVSISTTTRSRSHPVEGPSFVGSSSFVREEVMGPDCLADRNVVDENLASKQTPKHSLDITAISRSQSHIEQDPNQSSNTSFARVPNKANTSKKVQAILDGVDGAPFSESVSKKGKGTEHHEKEAAGPHHEKEAAGPQPKSKLKETSPKKSKSFYLKRRNEPHSESKSKKAGSKYIKSFSKNVRDSKSKSRHERVKALVQLMDSDSFSVASAGSLKSAHLDSNYCFCCGDDLEDVYVEDVEERTYSDDVELSSASEHEDASVPKTYTKTSPSEELDIDEISIATNQLLSIAKKLNMEPSEIIELIEADGDMKAIFKRLGK